MVGAGILAAFLLYIAYFLSNLFGYVSLATVLSVGIPLPVFVADFTYQSTLPGGLFHYLVVIYYGLTAGFVEEITFRGLPWAILNARSGSGHVRTYVLVSSFSFAAIHWENGTPELIAAFGFGVVAALLYLKLKNLWPMIIAHSLIDITIYW